ncbi:MAG: hypothetical protein ACLTZW_05795 [Paratractidigestivibacter faecalis]
MLLALGHAQDLDDGDVGAGLGDHAQQGGARALLVLAGRGHHDGGARALADHDAGVCHLALVCAHGDHDGLLAVGAARHLDVAGVGRLGADPVGDLLAHAALDLGEELWQRKVHVSLAGDAGHGEGYVVSAQAVPGLRGRGAHALERDGARVGGRSRLLVLLVSH